MARKSMYTCEGCGRQEEATNKVWHGPPEGCGRQEEATNKVWHGPPEGWFTVDGPEPPAPPPGPIGEEPPPDERSHACGWDCLSRVARRRREGE